MGRGTLVPDRVEAEEWIDSFEHPEADFDASFRDIRRINRFLGGTSVVQRRLRPWMDRPTLSILDVGTGSADIPAALCRWGRARHVRIEAVGVDANPKVLRIARRDAPEVRVLQADASALPFADASFDIVLSSLTFHHFEERQARQVLQEMHRVARRAVVVNDLRRGYLPAALIWLVTRVTRMHPLTRHDAPLSVLRARTLPEYRELAEAAGLRAEVYAHPFWRAALVVAK